MKLSYECKKIGLVFLMSMLIFSLAGCTGTGNGTQNTNITNNNFSVVVFSDVHFNPFYDRTLFRRWSPMTPTSGQLFFSHRSQKHLRHGVTIPTTPCLRWHSPA